MCGTGPDAAYVAATLDGVRAAGGGGAGGGAFHHVSAFIGPGELASVFRATAVNVHTPLADAYGMTVVEAAALRCLGGSVSHGLAVAAHAHLPHPVLHRARGVLASLAASGIPAAWAAAVRGAAQ